MTMTCPSQRIMVVLYQNLKLLRETDGKADCNLFRAMGLDYIYVNEGNDIAASDRGISESKRYQTIRLSFISIR